MLFVYGIPIVAIALGLFLLFEERRHSRISLKRFSNLIYFAFVALMTSLMRGFFGILVGLSVAVVVGLFPAGEYMLSETKSLIPLETECGTFFVGIEPVGIGQETYYFATENGPQKLDRETEEGTMIVEEPREDGIWVTYKKSFAEGSWQNFVGIPLGWRSELRIPENSITRGFYPAPSDTATSATAGT